MPVAGQGDVGQCSGAPCFSTEELMGSPCEQAPLFVHSPNTQQSQKGNFLDNCLLNEYAPLEFFGRHGGYSF